MKLLRKVWTDDERRKLVAAIEADMSVSRAAVVFNRTQRGLVTQARKLGIKFKTIKERKREMKDAEGAAPMPTSVPIRKSARRRLAEVELVLKSQAHK